MNPLMPSPGIPKTVSTPQSASRSNTRSAVVFAIAATPFESSDTRRRRRAAWARSFRRTGVGRLRRSAFNSCAAVSDLGCSLLGDDLKDVAVRIAEEEARKRRGPDRVDQLGALLDEPS